MINLAEYANKKICVAVSGGRDSMALLHYLYTHACEYGIVLSALNCDHKIRGEASANDSRFVKEWCAVRKIPLIFFEWDCNESKTEGSARNWRLSCYKKVLETHTRSNGTKWQGADVVATAHHLNDNAETVLFNLARGSALSGLTGITDGANIIHPIISCTREEIDAYVKANNVAFVDDETNFTDGYTRNKIRHNVIPELEKAVPNCAKAIYRFSRLAAEDEEYFDGLIDKLGLIKRTRFGTKIEFCEEKVIFRRTAVKAVKQDFDKKDYTFEQAERLYSLQFSENGKKFEFLGLTAYKEEGGIVITCSDRLNGEAPFHGYGGTTFCGQKFVLSETLPDSDGKILKFDVEKIPSTAIIRFAKEGDKFTKFGGGTKSLGDWFTDKKIPVRLRGIIPLIADGNDILAVGGLEISEKIKITQNTERTFYLVCEDYKGDKL